MKKAIKLTPVPDDVRQGSGVRAPSCPVHKKPMTFNSADNWWECGLDGCSLVSQPRKDVVAIGRDVTIGRGEVKLVVVAKRKASGSWNRDDFQISLMSENLVALNVTEHLLTGEPIAVAHLTVVMSQVRQMKNVSVQEVGKGNWFGLHDINLRIVLQEAT